MKKVKVLLMMAALGVALSACGPAEETVQKTETVSATEQQPAGVGQEEQNKETAPEEPVSKEPITEGTSKEAAESEAADTQAGGQYTDNFSVDNEAAAEFAERIKTAVSEQDLEALADLASYPMYMGIAEGTVSSREDFVALGAEKVFSKELVTAVEEADMENLSAGKAGFILSNGGKANIIFGVSDGELAITGINY